jgi:1-acyl-sn-glycerol-3-phosphate acyltransferase
VCSNHLHLADIPVVVVSLRRKVVFMAKEELFRGRLSRHLVHNFGAFPVGRGQLDRQAIREAETALGKGWALVMFPEGQRSRAAQIQPAFPGSALVASRAGVPILPIGISGTEHITERWWFFRRPRITVSIGAPFRLPSSEGVRLDSEELDRRTGVIMQRIAALVPPEYRGHYGDSVGGQNAV